MGYRSLISLAKTNNLVVLDNSVVMRWFFNDGSDEDLSYAESVLKYCKTNKSTLVVPSLWLSESSFVSASCVKRAVVESELVIEKLIEAFNLFAVVECHFSAAELYKFSAKYSLSSYDSNYALLAGKLGCPLSTLDKKLRRSTIQSGGVILEL